MHILPYRGLGTGIPRALHDWPDTDLIDDVAANQFRVVIRRPPADRVAITPEVTPEVVRLLSVLKGEMSRMQIMAALGLKDEKHFRENYQRAAIASGLIEMTRPETPKSRLQQYRLTDKGLALVKGQKV